jgi:hypothetical protein
VRVDIAWQNPGKVLLPRISLVEENFGRISKRKVWISPNEIGKRFNRDRAKQRTKKGNNAAALVHKLEGRAFVIVYVPANPVSPASRTKLRRSLSIRYQRPKLTRSICAAEESQATPTANMFEVLHELASRIKKNCYEISPEFANATEAKGRYVVLRVAVNKIGKQFN